MIQKSLARLILMLVVMAGSTSILLHRAEIDEWTKIIISISIGCLGSLLDFCKSQPSMLLVMLLDAAMFGGIVNLALLLVAPNVPDLRKLAISMVVGVVATTCTRCADSLLPDAEQKQNNKKET